MKRQLTMLAMMLLALLQARAIDNDSLLLSRQENYERFSKAFPQERVYVHFDNTSYYKGEQIWYKAYVVRDDNFHHTNLSRILYVELLNPIGYPIETQKLPIVNGQANGSFQLKDTLNAGFYEVRAYTTWMLNFTTGDPHGWHRMYTQSAKRRYGERLQRYLQGNAGIFSRVFPIYEKVDSGQYSKRRMPRLNKATATMVTPEKEKLFIDFYPEGGNLVRDVQSRVAFQARNAQGRTLNVAGALMRRGDSIGYFRSEYAGRGVFAVTPDSLDTENLTDGLELKLTYQGKNYKFPLPKPKKRGFTLGVYASDHQLKTIVARNKHTKGEQLGLSVTTRGHTVYYDMIDLHKELQSTIVLDNSTLETGVNIVTLFTTDGKVLAQRQVFINNHDHDGYRLLAQHKPDDDQNLEPYGKITLDYQLVDGQDCPVHAAHDFSIAVTDGDSREMTYDDVNALSYLLLSSEVKGFIPHPAYYFESDDSEHRSALDLLLMVQGWTRYDYEQMISDTRFEPMLPIERGLSFTGRVWDDNDYQSRIFWKLQNKKPRWIYSELYVNGDTISSQPIVEDNLSPFVEQDERGHQQLILTGENKIDSTGTFRLNMLPFYGKGRLAMVLNKESIETLGIEKGGIGAHNFRWNTVRRPLYLIGKRIEPLNQYSPLPKGYDYYETAALTDPMDPDMFRKGFMAVPKGNQGRLTYYDAISDSYVLPEVQKKQRRRWSDFYDVSPVCVMNVKDMMAWLSNIYGDIQDFNMYQRNPYATGGPIDHTGSHDHFIAEMMMQDALEMDLRYGGNDNEIRVQREISRMREVARYDIENSRPFYANLSEMLYIFGLDGMNCTYVNAADSGGMPHYTTATGSPELLPYNLNFFPINENFQTLKLYADVDNRTLTHRLGRYREAVLSYESGQTTNNDHPLTSIFNFITGNTYSNTHPLPDFLGFRINFQGFTRPAEFFCPNYDWEPEPEETDYRRTIYWNPSATTNDKGQAHLEFYNNGFSRSIAVSAEGITAGGTPICGASVSGQIYNDNDEKE